MVIQRNWLKN